MPELTYEFWEAPLQAMGTVHGRGFYFRARHPTWEFEIENDAGELPSDAGGNPILRVQGWYPNTKDMTHADARRIIERCAAMYAELIAS